MRSTASKTFKAAIERIGPGGSWTRFQIPFDVEKTFGSRARVAVHGTLNGFAFRSSIFPNGDGTHHMMLNKALLAGAAVGTRKTIDVVMAKDEESREVVAPHDLLIALEANAEAKAIWTARTPTFRKDYVVWIEEAKSAETRARRIGTTVSRVETGKRRYD